MPHLILVKCDDTEVLFETEEKIPAEKKPQKVSVSESVKKAMLSFDKISDTIKAYCTSLVKTFKEFHTEHAPNRIKVEYGLKLSGEGNVYIVKSVAEGSLKITAEWEMK